MKAIIIAVVGALVAVIVLVYVLVMPTQPTVITEERRPAQPASQLEDVAGEAMQGSGSLRALLARTRPLECAITYQADSMTEVTGTYFVSDGRLRGDFVTKYDDMEIVSHMIMADQVFYTWSEVMGERYGMRIDLHQVQLGAEGQPDTREPVPLDAVVVYDCRAWPNVDASVFAPPGDILWQDYSAIIERGMEAPVLYE